jgi:predicted ATPase/class 3 adenylate cyclase
MPASPTDTVTFLFTDIEGSTRLWEQHPEAMRDALARHDALLRGAIEGHGGSVFKTVGDAFCAAFTSAADALAAAVAAQRNVDAEAWDTTGPLRVRMALHTGAAEERDGDYFGAPLNRVARLLATGHGGQVLLSRATYEHVREVLPSGTSLRDLGSHRLKDLQHPEHVFQLLHHDLPADFPPLRSLQGFAHNLPVQLTSFIGREHEMADVKRLLTATRLLALTGVGGCGKTRLALQVAADLLDQYQSGVWLVELAALADPTIVPQTVASVLGVREEGSRPLMDTLVDFLRAKVVLLVLDNCEHLLTACAQLAATLLRSCPNLRILASSREGLGVAGEMTYRVPSLSLPDLQHPSSIPTDLPATLMQYEAVRLFVERAVFAQPRFSLTGSNALVVAQVCQRLDGIPLAIELAAARVKVLSVDQIAQRLDDRFRLLTGGSRSALPRQQTLRATIDWSYNLLSDAERILLRRLSVFAGGWTLVAAEHVCAGDGIDGSAVLDLLAQLVEKSLVIAEEDENGVRYHLLETVRQYGRDRLVEGAEPAAVRNRHLAVFLRLAEEAAPHLLGEAVADRGAWLQRLAVEHDNLRGALEWALAADTERALRLGEALHGFWFLGDAVTEGRGWLEKLLRVAPEGTAARAKALCGAAHLAWNRGDADAARAWFEEGIAICRTVGEARYLALSLGPFGVSALVKGDVTMARSLTEEGVKICREAGRRWDLAVATYWNGFVVGAAGDQSAARPLFEECQRLSRELHDDFLLSLALEGLGLVAARSSDYATAQAQFEEALTKRRMARDKWSVALVLDLLGQLARLQGDLMRATEFHRECLELYGAMGATASIAQVLHHLAAEAQLRDQHNRAARLFAAVDVLHNAGGMPPPTTVLLIPVDWQHDLTTVRAGLGEEAFAAACAAGRAMTMEQAIEYALSDRE